LLTGSSNLPIPDILRPWAKKGNEQLRFRDLFGFSTPEVYRNPGRPGKPWALTPRFHPYPPKGGRFIFCGTCCRRLPAPSR